MAYSLNCCFRRLLNIAFFLILCLASFTTYGQNYTFYHYGIKDGLSQETIRTILKDSNGFLWLGTQDGLNRFDGTSFKVYKNQKNDSLSLSGNFINTLLEDNQGNIWIGTNDNGISIYNSQVNSFNSSPVNTGNCTSISKTSDGTIIATVLNQGIYIFENGGDTFYKISEVNGETLQFNRTFVNNDSLYVSTQDGRLFVSESDLKTTIKLKEIKLSLPVGTIEAIFIENNNIWLGTINGLFIYEKNKKRLSKITLNEKIESKEKLRVSSIDVSENIFYIGTFDGLYITKDFDDKDLKFQDIKSYFGEQSHRNSITSNRVYDTYTDGSLLWIGTNNLDVVPLAQPVFKTINTTSEIKLNNAFTLSFAKNDDYIFIGTRKGINCIDNQGNVTYITKENTNEALAFNVIRSLAIDHNNYMWVGTIKGASIIDLNNFNPKSPKIISFYHDNENPKSLSSDATRGVFVDHNGTVWIMTYGGGVNRFVGDVGKNNIAFEHYKTKANENSISSNFTYNMSQDKNMDYWITSEEGLNKLHFNADNYEEPIFTNFFNEETDSTTISSNTTLHTWHDANGTLWVATQDGFNKFNSQNKTFKRYGLDQGLSNTFVYSITEDQDNNLWLTTNGGLFRFNKKTEVFTNYTPNDGLQSSEFNLGAHYYNKDTNEIYVGGINGVNIFNPRNVPQLDIPGNLTFTSLRIKDEEINPLLNSGIITKSITETDEITLRHTDFPCYISFSDLDLRPNKNNQFVYSLDDNEWNNLSGDREIPLLDLPKGKHVLKIQGASRNIIWEKEPLALQIEVIPPWYQSNIAYLFYLALFLGTVYAFYKISLQRQLAAQESKRLQELDDLKTRFITNITHEFRTPLTIVLGYLENLKARFSKDKDVSKSLDTIEQNSFSLLSLVNQMLDLAKLEKGQLKVEHIHGDIVPFVSQIVDSFKSIAADRSISVSFNAQPSQIHLDFDPEKMRQIVTNLISNALKFSPDNSTVDISLNKTTANRLEFKIKDEGYGIPKDKLPFIFDRFYQVEHSAHKISQGTGIGLALTKELVELLDGSLKVQSKENRGTTFIIDLPITSNAATQDISLPKSPTNRGVVFPKSNDVIAIDDANSVLIVEDNTDMAHFIASCLRPNYKVIFAQNGEEGLTMANETIPDIIITDVMMPVMDGFELTQKLQNSTQTNHIPIIMLTSKAMQEDKIAGIGSGADAYLTKPFQKEELLLRMQKLIEKRKKLQEFYSMGTVVAHSNRPKKSADKNLIFLNSVIETINEHLEDSNFGPTELAQQLAMSDSQLYRKLKAISNTSTALFMRKVRLEKGKKLLKTTDLNVSEIAFATGFNDPNWFSKTFKEEFGKSPTSYRN
ncbi:ATP-binding protein [uncultured Winogradskyella sp.]|uniref:hybrid sensor histidine kinase/response regulator transcription factor n=1 Tax=uncultured Winogradskyella sp. TaxID=395353 RepID=UPI0035119895